MPAYGRGGIRDVGGGILQTAAHQHGTDVGVVHRRLDGVDDRVRAVGVEPVPHRAPQVGVAAHLVDRLAQLLHVVGVHQLDPVQRVVTREDVGEVVRRHRPVQLDRRAEQHVSHATATQQRLHAELARERPHLDPDPIALCREPTQSHRPVEELGAEPHAQTALPACSSSSNDASSSRVPIWSSGRRRACASHPSSAATSCPTWTINPSLTTTCGTAARNVGQVRGQAGNRSMGSMRVGHAGRERPAGRGGAPRMVALGREPPPDTRTRVAPGGFGARRHRGREPVRRRVRTSPR